MISEVGSAPKFCPPALPVRPFQSLCSGCHTGGKEQDPLGSGLPPCPCTVALQLLRLPAPKTCPLSSAESPQAVHLPRPQGWAWRPGRGGLPGHTVRITASLGHPLPRQTILRCLFPTRQHSMRRPLPAGLQAQDAGCAGRALTPLPPGHRIT